MIESLAQLGGVLAQSSRANHPLQNVRLTAVRQFKILGSITPGETMLIHAKQDAVMPGLVQISGEITRIDGSTLATGSVILSGEE
jgi:3-hydroxymyristoyl/3-hydroxydecanoyl-(acyl carrier protein) dehydratase